jgi:hypothetical protein
MLVIPALSRLRQDNCEFKTSLDYIVRPHLNNNSNNKSPANCLKMVVSFLSLDLNMLPRLALNS